MPRNFKIETTSNYGIITSLKACMSIEEELPLFEVSAHRNTDTGIWEKAKFFIGMFSQIPYVNLTITNIIHELKLCETLLNEFNKRLAGNREVTVKQDIYWIYTTTHETFIEQIKKLFNA